jgi:hypothetical protein
MRVSIHLNEDEIKQAVMEYLINHGHIDKTTAQLVCIECLDERDDSIDLESIRITIPQAPKEVGVKNNGEIVRRV